VTITESPSVRCAAWIREQEVDPIGTAGSYAGYLLVEWPLPWPRDIGEIPELAPIVEALKGTGLRLQGLVPLFGDEEARRVVRYTPRADPTGAGGFVGYQRDEHVVPVERLEAAALDLIGGSDGDPQWARSEITDDVLVCTHGKRDICCGSQGTALFMSLSADPARFGGTVRLWRTSHTGGHRFAPTGIVLPQGTAWAFLDEDVLRRVVHRDGPLDDLLPHYRGCPAIGKAPVQVVEREAFREVGWEWLEWSRRGSVVDADAGVVQVLGVSPSGATRTWEGVVEVARQVPVPECGAPIEAAKKSEPEYRLVSITS
jgi:hypothetical protein